MTSTPTRRGWTSPAIVLRAVAITVSVSSVAACVTQGTVVEHSVSPAERPSVELADTPFYSDTEHQFGPAALAIVLGASGVTATPAELTPAAYAPSPQTSMQTVLMSMPRKYARLSYQIAPQLAAILTELDASRPVLVLQNSGASLLSKSHFAVVIGYDSHTDTIVLRSAGSRRQVVAARNFMLAWSNAERWAMLVLRPGDLPAAVSRERYLQAAADFELAGRPEDSTLAFDAALKRWPDEPLAWIGRAEARLQAGDPVAAARDYRTALRIDGSNAGARNSLAMILLDLGCIHRAQSQIDRITESALADPLRSTVEHSRDRIADRSQNLMAQEPPACAQF